jgi:hypothetical protein
MSGRSGRHHGRRGARRGTATLAVVVAVGLALAAPPAFGHADGPGKPVLMGVGLQLASPRVPGRNGWQLGGTVLLDIATYADGHDPDQLDVQHTIAALQVVSSDGEIELAGYVPFIAYKHPDCSPTERLHAIVRQAFVDGPPDPEFAALVPTRSLIEGGGDVISSRALNPERAVAVEALIEKQFSEASESQPTIVELPTHRRQPIPIGSNFRIFRFSSRVAGACTTERFAAIPLYEDFAKSLRTVPKLAPERPSPATCTPAPDVCTAAPGAVIPPGTKAVVHDATKNSVQISVPVQCPTGPFPGGMLGFCRGILGLYTPGANPKLVGAAPYAVQQNDSNPIDIRANLTLKPLLGVIRGKYIRRRVFRFIKAQLIKQLNPPGFSEKTLNQRLAISDALWGRY